jgi:hypothetical protein
MNFTMTLLCKYERTANSAIEKQIQSWQKVPSNVLSAKIFNKQRTHHIPVFSAISLVELSHWVSLVSTEVYYVKQTPENNARTFQNLNCER